MKRKESVIIMKEQNLKEYKFTMRVDASASGNVFAKSAEDARKRIKAGEWDDIDIDVEDVMEIESVTLV